MKQIPLKLFLLALADCIETKDELTLNPDRTGKLEHDAVFQPVNLNLSSDRAKP